MSGAKDHRTLLVRVIVLGVAVAACAWFALGAVQVHDQSRAAALIPNRTSLSRAQYASVIGLLDRAATLNPDRTVDIVRAEAEEHSGRSAAAKRLMLALVKDEPDNIDAWILLEIAAAPGDRATERLAIDKQQALAPPVPAAP